MAIYHLSVQTINRKNKSSVAAAAYRSAQVLQDDRTGQTYDYRRKAKGVVASFVHLPKTADRRFTDRSVLWNTAEAAERRGNANTAREMTIALPHELNDTERTHLIKRFADWLVGRYQVAADVAIHRPDRQGDQRNHHAHVMFTTREVHRERFGAKTRRLDVWPSGRNEINRMRGVWQDMANDALEAVGVNDRIDHRSHKTRGIEIPPQIHEGVHATAMRRRGKPVPKSCSEYVTLDRGRTRAEYNAEIIALQTYDTPSPEIQLEQLEARIAALQAQIKQGRVDLSNLHALPPALAARIKEKMRAFILEKLFREQWAEIIERRRIETAQAEEALRRKEQKLDWLVSQRNSVLDTVQKRTHDTALKMSVDRMTWPPPAAPITLDIPPITEPAITAYKHAVRAETDERLMRLATQVERPHEPSMAVYSVSKGAMNAKELLRRSGTLKPPSTPALYQNAPVEAHKRPQSAFNRSSAKEIPPPPQRRVRRTTGRKRRRRKRH